MNPIIRYEPLTGRLDGLFEELFRPGYPLRGSDEPAPIRFDVRESPEAYVVSAELPGVKKDAIQVEIEGNEVTISAEVSREATAGDNEKWLRTERFVGKVARRFALPQEVDEARAEARSSDGVLELRLPKKAQVTGRKIAVQ